MSVFYVGEGRERERERERERCPRTKIYAEIRILGAILGLSMDSVLKHVLSYIFANNFIFHL